MDIFYAIKIINLTLFGPISFTVQNSVILRNFLVWKFCGKTQSSHNFLRIARNSAETVPFHKISTP